jgi:hypothetical protein
MENRLVVAVALAAGLAGGMLTRYIAPPTAYAQAPATPPQTPVTDELRARSFVLVDQFNDSVGTFTAEPISGNNARTSPGPGPLQRGVPARIVLRDAYGHQIWSAGGTVLRPLDATVR